MDTLSRDSSSSSSNIVPMAGLFAAVLALILAIVALVKLSTLQKTVATHQEAVDKIPAIENDARSASTAAAKADSDIKSLYAGVQKNLQDIGTEFGKHDGRITKLEEAAKKAPVAAPGGKGGSTGGGTVDANGNYTVAPGDTLSKVARKFGVKIDSIQAENPGLSNSLKPGQKIKIPKK